MDIEQIMRIPLFIFMEFMTGLLMLADAFGSIGFIAILFLAIFFSSGKFKIINSVTFAIILSTIAILLLYMKGNQEFYSLLRATCFPVVLGSITMWFAGRSAPTVIKGLKELFS